METNYPATIPTPGSMIPTAIWGQDQLAYSISDVLFNWNGHDYGIVLSPHVKAGASVNDGYLAGDFYQAPNTAPDFVPSGLINSFNVTGILPSSPRPDFPIWLAPGGTLLGNGTVTIAAGGNGTPAQYTITDSFSAPGGLLASLFVQASTVTVQASTVTIDASSWPCANGVIVGNGTFTTTASTPEPASFGLLAGASLTLMVAYRLRLPRKS
jgi:hypothetical protein